MAEVTNPADYLNDDSVQVLTTGDLPNIAGASATAVRSIIESPRDGVIVGLVMRSGNAVAGTGTPTNVNVSVSGVDVLAADVAAAAIHATVATFDEDSTPALTKTSVARGENINIDAGTGTGGALDGLRVDVYFRPTPRDN